MHFGHSQTCQRYLDQVSQFIEQHVLPHEVSLLKESEAMAKGGDWLAWYEPQRILDLRDKAKQMGLWNFFLPDSELAPGLKCVEYAPLAEQMGRSLFAPQVFNCQAPDTGNMEVLYHFGSEAQQQQWLTPLLAGDIRSVFAMTEPDVASSDATNICCDIDIQEQKIIINGRKWWTSGLGHPEAKIAIVMGVSDPDAPVYNRQSMVLVPLDSAGVKIKRMLKAGSSYDAPYGHGEMELNNVVVPKENLLMGSGQGFAIAQGRLGPGRIHHCMRAIGMAEHVLSMMIKRGLSRQAFGKPLIYLGGNREKIARARMDIEQARLLTLHTAWKIDEYGVKAAMCDIASIKVVAPSLLQRIVDQAIQMFGGAGVSDEHLLMHYASLAKILRIVDGPDDVHVASVAKMELSQYSDTHR